MFVQSETETRQLLILFLDCKRDLPSELIDEPREAPLKAARLFCGRELKPGAPAWLMSTWLPISRTPADECGGGPARRTIAPLLGSKNAWENIWG